MKKRFFIIFVFTICVLCINTNFVGAASENPEVPTQLTINEVYESNIYSTHPNNYYTFEVDALTKIYIELDHVAMNHEYTMTLHGNGIEPISATQHVDEVMYIVETLTPGTYYIDVISDFVARTEEIECDYFMLVTDNPQNTFLYGTTSIDFKNVFLEDDFEDLSTENWLDSFRPHTTKGVKTIDPDNSDKYISFTAINPDEYYSFEATDQIYSTELLYSQFDINFPDGDAQIQVRQTISNLDVNFSMAGRIRKTYSYLEYYSNGNWYHFTDNNGDWITIDASKWYTIYMVFNIPENKYNIYLLDKDTENTLSKVEEVEFAQPCTYISYFAFSSTEEICLDNVHIGNVNPNINLIGRHYIAIPDDGYQQYVYYAKSIRDSFAGDLVWSIDNVSGVDIDSDTGVLTISESAKPGPVLISVYKKYYPWVKNTILVDLRK